MLKAAKTTAIPGTALRTANVMNFKSLRPTIPSIPLIEQDAQSKRRDAGFVTTSGLPIQPCDDSNDHSQIEGARSPCPFVNGHQSPEIFHIGQCHLCIFSFDAGFDANRSTLPPTLHHISSRLPLFNHPFFVFNYILLRDILEGGR
jgi:hypothetical protein